MCIMVLSVELNTVNSDKNSPFEKSFCNPVKNLTECIISTLSIFYDYIGKVGIKINISPASTDDEILYYFPSIIIDKDKKYHKIIDKIITKLNEISFLKDCESGYDRYGDFTWTDKNIQFEYNPRSVKTFDNSDDDGITIKQLKDLSLLKPTMNYIDLFFENEFDFLMGIFGNEREHFKRNLLYISSAFLHDRNKLLQKNFYTEDVCSKEWVYLCEKFDVNEYDAIEYFEKATNFSYTVITLHHIIRNINEKYIELLTNHDNELFRYKIKKILLSNTPPNDVVIGDVFSYLIRHKVFYDNGKIYKFMYSKCQEIAVENLSEEIKYFLEQVKIISKLTKGYIEKLGVTYDFTKFDENEKILQKKLSSTTYGSIVKYACEFYLKNTIRSGVEEISIPFRDGIVIIDKDILDPKAKRCLVKRKIYMEDQITKTGKANLFPSTVYNRDNRLVRDIIQTFNEIFDDDENVDWFLRWLASLFVRDPERVLLILYGKKGGNAKTTISCVLHELFGDYSCVGRVDMLLPQVGQGSTCDPYNILLKGCAIAIFSEITPNKQYSSESIKSMTGGDPKTAAAKYKNAETFKQTAKPLLLCNDVPNFDKIDEALLSRIYITLCKGRYLADAPETYEQQRKEGVYKADSNFWKRKGMIDALLWLILDNFDNYISNGLQKTSSQNSEINRWRKDKDPYFLFCQKYIKKSNTLTLSKVVYDYYIDLLEPSKRQSVSYEEFIDNFRNRLGYETEEHDNNTYFRMTIVNKLSSLIGINSSSMSFNPS